MCCAGGSVLGSAAICHEMLKYRKEGKPSVVSMGNLATSGGYHVAGQQGSLLLSLWKTTSTRHNQLYAKASTVAIMPVAGTGQSCGLKLQQLWKDGAYCLSLVHSSNHSLYTCLAAIAFVVSYFQTDSDKMLLLSWVKMLDALPCFGNGK